MAPRRKRPSGEKRSPAELAKLTERLRGYVAEHPGLRIEQINKGLGTSTKEVKLPMQKLIAEGAVRSQGTRRSMKYFAAGAGGGKAAKKK